VRRAARTDDNHVDVVAWGEAMALVEVKTKSGKLTKQQREFSSRWPPGFLLVTDDDDCEAVAALLKSQHQLLSPAAEATPRALH